MFVLLFAEMWTMPIGIVYPGSEVSGHSRVVQFLKDSADRLPVIELPLRANSAEMETGSMLRALEHGHPLISGYASFWPQTYMQLKRVSYGADKAKAGRYLDAYGAGYVVLHSHLLSSDEYEAFAAEIGGEIVFEDNGHTVLRRDIIPGTPVDVFPRKVMFGAHMPEVGNIYRIRLDRPIAREFMAVYRRIEIDHVIQRRSRGRQGGFAAGPGQYYIGQGRGSFFLTFGTFAAEWLGRGRRIRSPGGLTMCLRQSGDCRTIMETDNERNFYKGSIRRFTGVDVSDEQVSRVLKAVWLRHRLAISSLGDSSW
jgi:hypothetical protein